MKPRIFTVTIAKNEDRVIGATLDAWAPFAQKQLVIDTGSIDRTREILMGRMEDGPGHIEVDSTSVDVGRAMVARQELIDRVPKDEDNWIVLVDADEVMPPSQIEALMSKMQDPEIDYVGVRPVTIGYDLRTTYEPYYFLPEDLEDRRRFTTEHFCPKYSTRAWRSTRLDGVSNGVWGGETFYVKLDPDRHRLTPDFKEEQTPPGTISTMFSGRCFWSDIYFNHLSYMTRSSKWQEIPQIPGSNALDRARWRRMGREGRYPLPAHFEIPESVLRIASEGM